MTIKISIGAIFKDEFEYVLEWVAWHLNCGVEHFYIADNGSSDGTVELLEALEHIGLVSLIYQDKKPNAQIDAYNKILNLAKQNKHEVLFIDADEFLYSTEDSSPISKLKQLLLSAPHVGGICLNWKIFGSSGHLEKKNDFVTRRFTKYANIEMEQNKYIKSLVRPHAVEDVRVHCAQLKEGYHYLNILGEPPGFVNPPHISLRKPSGKTIKPIQSPLCINHYIVKSRQEYREKKRLRGDAMVGPNYDRGEAYFKAHDKNDLELDIQNINFELLEKKILIIKDRLKNETAYYNKASGNVAKCDNECIRGWFKYDNENLSEKVELIIYLNDKYYAAIEASNYREDLKTKFKSSGCHGFYYKFRTKLQHNDIVSIRPRSNEFKFVNNTFVIKNEPSFVMIVTYGRSGSTLLQSLINGMDGYKIRGENYNVLIHLYRAYKAVLSSKRHASKKTEPDWPFYLAENYDEEGFFNSLVDSFIKYIIRPEEDEINIGFKEVKYTDFGNELFQFLTLIKKYIPNIKIIFNFREHDDVVKSAWQKNYDKNSLIESFSIFEKASAQFYEANKGCSIILKYDDYISNSNKIEPLFELLNYPFDNNLIDSTFNKKLTHCK